VIDTRTHTTVLFFANSDSIERCLDILCLHVYSYMFVYYIYNVILLIASFNMCMCIS